MLNTIKAKLGSAFAYLSDSAHRRAVAAIAASVLTMIVGSNVDSGSVEIVLGALCVVAAVWAPKSAETDTK